MLPIPMKYVKITLTIQGTLWSLIVRKNQGRQTCPTFIAEAWLILVSDVLNRYTSTALKASGKVSLINTINIFLLLPI